MTELKKAGKAACSCSIFIDCPHCGEMHDLVDDDDYLRFSRDLETGKHHTEKTRQLMTWCFDCGKPFIVEDLIG